MKSLKQFIKDTKGKSINVNSSWDPDLKGECVSLVQAYVIQCYGLPAVARGHAKDYGNGLISRKEATAVSTPKRGDIVVYNGNLAGSGGLGHVGIYLDSNTLYDQNRSGNRTANERSLIKSHIYQYIRIKGDRPADETPSKNIDEIAKDVINGKYGNGETRRKKLEAEGYDYDAVQNRVNELLYGNKKDPAEVVDAVIRGDYGNGSERKQKLEAAGYDYDEVQKLVNRKLTNKKKKVTTTLVNKVIRGICAMKSPLKGRHCLIRRLQML